MSLYIVLAIIVWFVSGIIGGYRVTKEFYALTGMEFTGLSKSDIEWIIEGAKFGPLQLDPLSEEIKERYKND